MFSLPSISSFNSWAPTLLGILADAAVKGLFVLAAAYVLNLALRRASAAMRHLVWVLAMTSLLCLPVLSALLPQWHVGLLPQSVSGLTGVLASSSNSDAPATVQPSSRPVVAQSKVPVPTDALMSAPVAPAIAQRSVTRKAAALHWSLWILIMWAAGFVIVLFPLALGIVRVWWLASRAKPLMDESWRSLAASIVKETGFSSNIDLRQSDRATVPMACGIFRPLVMLPAEAGEWSSDRRRVVLLHELAHIRRHDCLTQWITHVAHAAHWFNPLTWLAVRRLHIERERACDDMVLNTGSKASDYADHLLDIARTLRSARCMSAAAVTIARPKRIEGRLIEILDPKRNRGTVKRFAVVSSFVLALAVIAPLAALHTVGATQQSTDLLPGDADWSVKLSSGAEVEFLAVRRHMAEEETFWRPDGAFLDEHLYGSLSVLNTEDSGDPYEFAFRIVLPDGVASCKFDVTGAISSSTTTAKSTKADKVHVHIASVTGDIRSVTVGLDIPSAKWEHRATSRAVHGLATVGFRDGVVIFGETYKKDGQTRLAVTDTLLNEYARLVAVDSSGTEHIAKLWQFGSNLDSVRQVTYGFDNLDLDNVEEFRFETCSYDRVEFRNVSLEPGVKTRVATVGGGDVDDRREMIAQIGLAFKMFTLDHEGRYPAKVGRHDVFQPELYEFEYFLGQAGDATRLAAYLTGQLGVKLSYLGYVVVDEESGLALLNELANRLEPPDEDIHLPESRGLMPTAFRIREGIERFFITDINNPGSSAMGQSMIPLVWEMPEPGTGGGWVLYMDGHVDWESYPGEFPMTERFISKLRGSTVSEPGTIEARPLTVDERQQLSELLDLEENGQAQFSTDQPYRHHASFYNVHSVSEATVWELVEISGGKQQCKTDEAGWGSSRLVDAGAEYYLPDGTPLRSRWEPRGDGMHDICVNVGRTVAHGELVMVVCRRQVDPKRFLVVPSTRERRLELWGWADTPCVRTVRLDAPLKLEGQHPGDGDVEESAEFTLVTWLLPAEPEGRYAFISFSGPEPQEPMGAASGMRMGRGGMRGRVRGAAGAAPTGGRQGVVRGGAGAASAGGRQGRMMRGTGRAGSTGPVPPRPE